MPNCTAASSRLSPLASRHVVSADFSIGLGSHITNHITSGFVRTSGNDFTAPISHNRNMARRGVPKQINWYLREWMDSTELFRGRGGQARMMEETGWSKATMSQLYNNLQDYSPAIINAAAAALKVEPFELLMRPERAMALRRQLDAALVLAHDADELEKIAKTG